MIKFEEFRQGVLEAADNYEDEYHQHGVFTYLRKDWEEEARQGFDYFVDKVSPETLAKLTAANTDFSIGYMWFDEVTNTCAYDMLEGEFTDEEFEELMDATVSSGIMGYLEYFLEDHYSLHVADKIQSLIGWGEADYDEDNVEDSILARFKELEKTDEIPEHTKLWELDDQILIYIEGA